MSRWHPTNKTKIKKLLRANVLTFEEIAHQFGVTKARIGQIANELGINGYSRRRARLAGKPEHDGTGDNTDNKERPNDSMAIVKRRNRIVHFRLSQDEYEELRTACTKRGGANISSFARAEVLRALDRKGPSGVSKQVLCLQSSVQRIAEILETMAASKESK